MTLYSNKIKIAIFILASLVPLALMAPISVKADVPPLSPGCYRPQGEEWEKVQCETEGQARSIVAPHNKCFVGATSGALQEVDCNTLDDISPVDPEESTQGHKFIINDCNNVNLEAGAPETSEQHCGILNYIVIAINILSALVGIVVVGSIIYGGIQYSMAGSDPQKISAAKERIRNAIIALLVFIFAYSFLNYLVPGGLY